ncbi:hypothetical protein [Mastigocladopsis repens]|uniref:hypothetical protein n=1 Tax=Mastigocladopsis repens TaxID=221287 RepID=UPI0002FCE5B9|nr:hypothetical protein [Mastigocladopsis repens]
MTIIFYQAIASGGAQPIAHLQLMSSDASYNQIAFALEILKQLAQKPRNRDELADLLSLFVDAQGKSADEMDITAIFG